jgi:hypothetical protein
VIDISAPLRAGKLKADIFSTQQIVYRLSCESEKLGLGRYFHLESTVIAVENLFPLHRRLLARLSRWDSFHEWQRGLKFIYLFAFD